MSGESSGVRGVSGASGECAGEDARTTAGLETGATDSKISCCGVTDSRILTGGIVKRGTRLDELSFLGAEVQKAAERVARCSDKKEPVVQKVTISFF